MLPPPLLQSEEGVPANRETEEPFSTLRRSQLAGFNLEILDCNRVGTHDRGVEAIRRSITEPLWDSDGYIVMLNLFSRPGLKLVVGDSNLGHQCL